MASTEMEIEIEAPDHSKMVLNSDCETEIGRASSAFAPGHRTISRRHVLLKLPSAAAENRTADAEPRACFEVSGKNPVWVRRGKQGKIEIFRRSERGELGCGDAVCVSGKSPAWFLVKRSGDNGDRDSVTEEDGNKNAIDLESIDPVKEFGFVVAGHEFDQYPKHRIRDVMNWKWFLEESGEESCDSEDGARSGGRSRKRRKSAEKEGSDDEDWTGEHEEDREVMARAKKTGKPAYTTRSRDSKRTVSGKPKGGSSGSVAKMSVEEESEDEDDETLGGFIIEDDDDNVAELEEEDEEEFDDEEDDE